MEILITEQQEQLLINHCLNEALDYSEKRLLIKKFLDDNFQRGSIDSLGKDGEPSKTEVVVRLTQDKKPIKTMDDKQLFYYLQAKYRDILPESERDDFLKDTIKKWYHNKISKAGSSLN